MVISTPVGSRIRQVGFKRAVRIRRRRLVNLVPPDNDRAHCIVCTFLLILLAQCLDRQTPARAALSLAKMGDGIDIPSCAHF